MDRPLLQLVAHGPPALAALHDAVAAAKAGDALAPVTVAVPHPWAGLSLRRSLAALPGGVVNVRFMVMPRISELLGAPVLAATGRRPRTATATRAAVRAVLRTEPGAVLAPVADHPATEAAVVRFVEDIASVDDTARRRLASTGARVADLVALAERVLARVPDRYDRHNLARAAAEVVRTHPRAAEEVGTLVLHLPTRLAPAELDLVAALAAAGRARALVGVTGHPGADVVAERLVARLEPLLGAPAGASAPSEPPIPQRIVTTTDPDEEVRAALRLVAERWDAGTPLERTAIAFPTAEPYARLLQEHAEAAGLPVAGAATTTLTGSVPGRTLLGALDLLSDPQIPRDALIDWLAAAPVLDPDGRRAPVARWDVLTRSAGIVGGDVTSWNAHLDAELARLEARIDRSARDTDPEALAERRDRQRTEVDRLRRLLGWLDDVRRRLERSTTWREVAGTLDALLLSALGPEGRWGSWPDAQATAGREVREAIERLGGLDAIEPEPRPSSIRRALTAELDTTTGRSGDLGRGLVLAPLHHVAGLDLDVVLVVGLAEGTLPGRTSDDALLPDADRAAAQLDLPRRADAVDEQHHRFLSVLASAPERILLMPRGDLRQGRARIPSRWLLDAAAHLAGHPVATDELDDLRIPAVEHVQSFTAGVAATGHPASLSERDLGDLVRWTTPGRRAQEHPMLDDLPGLARAMEVLTARQGGFSRFTGHVPDVEIPTFRSGGALSPTALERWAECPRKYFFAQVLRLRAEERPEFIDRLGARERGSLVHAVLDRFIQDAIDAGPKAPSEPWTPAERSHLHEIFEEVAAEYEEQGLTGRAVLWAMDRAAIRRELDRFLDADDEHRARFGATPIATELPFGPDDPTQAVLELPGGRRVAFRGFADRVDRTADGRLIVIDYKTGSVSSDVKEIPAGDPIVRGTKLQLPVYALAARAAHGPDAEVHTAYWHVSDKGEFSWIGYDTSPDTDARVHDALTTIADGIESGIFPGRPGDPSTRPGRVGWENCTYCDFDVVCTRSRGQEWEQIQDAPELRPLLVLAGELADDTEEAP